MFQVFNIASIFFISMIELIISFSYKPPAVTSRTPAWENLDVMKWLIYFMLLITTNGIYFPSLCIFIAFWYKIILFLVNVINKLIQK